jgi:hypothetical protein
MVTIMVIICFTIIRITITTFLISGIIITIGMTRML